MLARTLWLGSSILALAAPSARAQESPSPGAIEPAGPPVVAALFHPWYDASSGAHFQAADGSDSLRHHFVDPTIVRPDSIAWFEQELEDAAAAGIDALLVANVPAPANAEVWMPALRQALENVAPRLARPVRVGLLLDPYGVAVERAGGEGAAAVAKLDLRDPIQRADFFAPVERFFATFPPPMQATVDGSPLLAIGAAGAVGAHPDDLFAQLEQSVAAIGGRRPWLVLEKSWDERERPQWRAGSALLGVQDTGSVVCLGPGSNGRPGRGAARLLRLREAGATYESDWRRALATRPRLVILESWNQMHDGSALCTTIEHGKSYIEATRRASDRLHAGLAAEPALPSRPTQPLLADAVAEDRSLALADVASFLPGVEEGGVRLDPPPRVPSESASAARLSFERDPDGAAVLRITPRPGATTCGARFNVSRVFLGLDAADYDVELDATAGSEAVDVEMRGASQIALTRFDAGETRVVSGRIVGHPSHVDLESTGGALAVRSLTLRRRTGVLPDSRIGISDPSLFDLPDPERLAAAHALGAAWFRCEVPWTAIAPDPATCDVTRVVRLVAAIRAAGMEPMIALRDPPAWAQPVGAHSQDVAEVVRRIAAGCGDALRFLELFPRANRPGGFARVSDPQGHVRVLRAAAKAAHAENPRLSLVLGGVAGPDTTWIRTIDELRERFAYDAIALLAIDESGEPGGRTFAHELGRAARALAAGSDARKPFFVELGATTRPSPLLSGASGALLPELIATAWKRLELPASTVHLLDAPELPRVKGLAAGHACELLERAGIAVVARPLAELLDDLDGGRVQTLLLASGEVVPSALVPRIPTFLDRGGLLVTFGGAPFRRLAVAGPVGAFELAEDPTPALELRDELRIALARHRAPSDATQSPAAAPITWTSGPTVPGLTDRFAPTPGDASLFTERTGLPRNDHGYHRYEPLITAQAGDRELGAVAAVIAFSGARRGALLLIGVDADDHGLSDSEQAAALRGGFSAALAAGARVVFWRGLADPPTAGSGGGLLRSDGARRDAADAFMESAGAERKRPK